jgi:hypothetical protein
MEKDCFDAIEGELKNPPKANEKLLQAAAKHRQKNF